MKTFEDAALSLKDLGLKEHWRHAEGMYLSKQTPKGELVIIFRHRGKNDVYLIPKDDRDAMEMMQTNNPYEAAERFLQLLELLNKKHTYKDERLILPNPTGSDGDWASIILLLAGQNPKDREYSPELDGFVLNLMQKIAKDCGLPHDKSTSWPRYSGKTMKGFMRWFRKLLVNDFGVDPDQALASALQSRFERKLSMQLPSENLHYIGCVVLGKEECERLWKKYGGTTNPLRMRDDISLDAFAAEVSRTPLMVMFR